MFSPELMKFIIKYQDKEFLPKEDKKQDRTDRGSLVRGKFVTIPIKIKD